MWTSRGLSTQAALPLQTDHFPGSSDEVSGRGWLGFALISDAKWLELRQLQRWKARTGRQIVDGRRYGGGLRTKDLVPFDPED